VQSIGAGGGLMGVVGASSVEVTMGGVGGAQGDGGQIVASNGDVTTKGFRAHGFVAQSIGGGGGLVITDENSQVTVFTDGERQGNGGEVSVDLGSVSIEGEEAIGVLAQSIGGGGGAVNSEFLGSAYGTGTASDVSVSIDRNVSLSGADSTGIYAQSQAKGNVGDIDISIGGDLWVGGSRAVGAKADTFSLEGSTGAIALGVTGNVEAAGEDAFGIDAFVSSTQEITKAPQLTIGGSLLASGVRATGVLAGAASDVISMNSRLEVGADIGASGVAASGVKISHEGDRVSGGVDLVIGQHVYASGVGSVGADATVTATEAGS